MSVSVSGTKAGAQTVDRALRLMQLVVESPQRLTNAGIALRLGVNKSSAYRLARSLEDAGFLMREGHKHGYTMGSALLALSASVMGRIDVRAAARPYLERLNQQFGETVTLHVRIAYARVCVDSIEGHFPVRRVVPLGESFPLYAKPSGRAIMAYLADADREDLMQRAAAEGFSLEKIEAQMRSVRERGFVAEVQAGTPTLGGLSVPVRNGLEAVASLTVSGPALRWTMAEMLRAAPYVTEQARALSRDLGAEILE